jgi:putative ABC transport system permease protein
MTWVALKMLIADRGKYYAIVFGIAFACMLMAQQASIFVGLMRNTTSQIRDVHGVDIWVMEPSVQFVDDVTPLSNNDLYRVRGVPGVAWAERLYKGLARAQFHEGNFKQFLVLGLDDQSFVGAPDYILLGALADLRRPDAVIIDEYGYRYLWPDQPFRTGQTFEMNDHRAQVVGICKASPTFQTFPIVYTRYSQALAYAPQERRVLSFILVGAAPGASIQDVCEQIRDRTRLLAVSQQNFAWMTITYYLRRTGIPINFGTTVLLGFVIGSSVAGQTFYLFTLGNLKQYGALKAMGLPDPRIVGMVLVQGLVVGLIGYGLGMGLASLLELAMKMVLKAIPPANYMAWQIPVLTALAVAAIVAGTSFLSLRRVIVLEPATVFR